MMRALLDTHALLWALTDPDHLGEEAGRVLRDRTTEPVVSAASAWEVATKARIGKLPGAERVIDRWPEHLERLGASEMPVSGRHGLLAGSLRWDHRDPFDRMLAAQALQEGLVLLTVDPVFKELVGLDARW